MEEADSRLDGCHGQKLLPYRSRGASNNCTNSALVSIILAIFHLFLDHCTGPVICGWFVYDVPY